jgi:hypothetical protein
MFLGGRELWELAQLDYIAYKMLYNVNKQGCLRTYWAQRQEREPLNRRGTKKVKVTPTQEKNLYCFKDEEEKKIWKEVHLEFSFGIK